MEQTGSTSWTGIRVRKGERLGTVTHDYNGFVWRNLTIKMDDGATETIRMNNKDEDPEETSEWEWFWTKSEPHTWYRF